MSTGRNRRFAIILSGLPLHVDWPDLKDELRKVSPNPSWVRVTPDRNGIFGVRESELDHVYNYLVLNSERIWPGHRLVVHVFDTTLGDRVIPVRANCQRETCSCRHNMEDLETRSSDSGQTTQELSSVQLQQMQQALLPTHAMQSAPPPWPSPSSHTAFPSSPVASDLSHSPMQSMQGFGADALPAAEAVSYTTEVATASFMFGQLMATPADRYVYSGRGLPVNVAQGVYPTEARSVMIKRLPFGIEEAELRTLLEAAGRLVGDVDLHRDKQGRTRYARARYATPAEANTAVAMFNEKLYKGLVIDVSLARDREPTAGEQEPENEESAMNAEARQRQGKGKEHKGPLVVRG